jgi:hypothetical protein
MTHKKRVTEYTLVLIWVFLPPMRAFLPNAAFYDGMRHFMEILPAAMILGAIGMEHVFVALKKRIIFARPLTSIILGGILIHLMLINITYFPYSTGYLNMLAKHPNERFDRDIEALSVKEGVDYLHTTRNSIKLWSPIGGHLSWYYLFPSDQYVYSAQEADSIILVNKSSHIQRKEFEALLPPEFYLVHTIQRGNALLGWVYAKASP